MDVVVNYIWFVSLDSVYDCVGIFLWWFNINLGGVFIFF